MLGKDASSWVKIGLSCVLYCSISLNKGRWREKLLLREELALWYIKSDVKNIWSHGHLDPQYLISSTISGSIWFQERVSYLNRAAVLCSAVGNMNAIMPGRLCLPKSSFYIYYMLFQIALNWEACHSFC